jgi:serine/threonine-protein kinase
MVGRTLGKYHIVETLGRGGMGTVYKAIDETLDREVAIKILNPDLVDEDTVKRFRNEAVTLAKLNHPRIAHLYELTREGDNLLMVMEYVRGETFEKLSTRTGPLPLDRAIVLCSQALEALHHAHAAGIVHRDLKPANLMLTTAGEVKVMDFGIARVVGTEHMTSDGFMMGTPAYMAPEQVRGQEVDARTDVYSMAVVLYRLVTAQLPFKADTAVAMIQSQLNDPPTPSRSYRTDLPEWLDAVLTRALEKAQEDRFQTAEELRAALQYSLTGTLSAVYTEQNSALDRSATPTSLSAADGSPATFNRPSPAAHWTPPAMASGHTTVTLRRRRVVSAGAVVGLLAVAAGLFAFAALRNTPPPQPPPVPPPLRARSVVPLAVIDLQPKPPVVMRPSVVPARAPIHDTPLSFKDVKFLVSENAKTRENDALLTLGQGSVTVHAEKSPRVFKAMPYRSIVKAIYEQSRKKRSLTLQSRSDFMVLNLDKDNVNLILAAIETRTGVRIQRFVVDR